ncbi:hypothetical protein NJR55_13300 [Idiomarina sp. M1R2S28]|uniref:Uncharacterized protein n=1 Tax=Idiomarina rhizosphaerae TaxID=2961572 RepID=A0A9X2FWU2_9GAMM|nr:hypothetical protein [Idiomarina rhizosphaerae]MCP1340556.1 hypothetical protein [Idiomarina rhizosphaerae]
MNKRRIIFIGLDIYKEFPEVTYCEEHRETIPIHYDSIPSSKVSQEKLIMAEKVAGLHSFKVDKENHTNAEHSGEIGMAFRGYLMQQRVKNLDFETLLRITTVQDMKAYRLII